MTRTEYESTLKPCPFCGGWAIVPDYFKKALEENSQSGETPAAIKCGFVRCGAAINVDCVGPWDSVREKWNLRVGPL